MLAVAEVSDLSLELHIAFFAGREDVYVVNAAEVRRSRLTPAVLRHAFEHRYAISTYMGDEHGQTHVGAIDFDRDDGLTLARAVQERVPQLSPLLVGSRRGAHLWFGVKDARISVGVMRKALTEALRLTDEPLATDTKIEVFPKRGSGELAVGALRLPGLPHQRTQVVYQASGRYVEGMCPEYLEGFQTYLRAHQPAPAGAFGGLSGGGSRPTAPYPRPGAYALRRDYAGATPKASEVLASWGVPNPQPGRTVRCPMHEDRHSSLTIFRDDLRVYCGAPACPLHNDGHGVGSVVLSRMQQGV